MNFSERNKSKQPVFNFNSDGFPWTDLNAWIAEHGNTPIEVKALFINEKAKFGPRAVLVSPEFKINLPNHMVDEIREIMATPDLVDLINADKAVFIPEQYEDKNGVTRNSGHFDDK